MPVVYATYSWLCGLRGQTTGPICELHQLLGRSLPFSIFVTPITAPQANLFHREQRKSLGHGMVPVAGLRRVRMVASGSEQARRRVMNSVDRSMDCKPTNDRHSFTALDPQDRELTEAELDAVSGGHATGRRIEKPVMFVTPVGATQ